MIRKYLVYLLLSCLLLTGCVPAQAWESSGKLTVVATLFPQYDFARQIGGEHIQLHLLLPPGVESHSYEPTPADMVRLNQSDLFLYTGRYMEPWAERLSDTLEGDVTVVDVSQGIQLDEEDAHEGHDHGAESGHDHDDHGGYDPHIWTSPVNAMQMVETIRDAFCEADPANAASYQANAQAYLEQLSELDASFRQLVETAPRKEIIFGGRFALHYFAKEYGISYEAAFDSCSSETEPSVGVMAHLVDHIRQERIPVVYYEELVDPKVARILCEETGAKPLLFHSCHNVSKEELKQGVTYLSLMEKNLENLKEGLTGWL